MKLAMYTLVHSTNNTEDLNLPQSFFPNVIAIQLVDFIMMLIKTIYIINGSGDPWTDGINGKKNLYVNRRWLLPSQ